jgi:ParB family chromosome partitioning protein
MIPVEKIGERDEHLAPTPTGLLRTMAFKDDTPRLEIVDLGLIDPDPLHVRKAIQDEALKGLVNAVRKLGLIHPIIVRPTGSLRYQVIAGERRRQAALQAGETTVPVIVRTCSDEEALEVRVFENIGLGVRSALEPREMANAVQAIAARFASAEEAAQYFGRAPTWLAQATAAANLSEKVSALLDSGKISSTSAAVQLEKLARKNEAKAESLIEQIAQLPEGEKVSKKVVDDVLSEESGRTRKDEERAAAAPVIAEPAAPQATAEDVPPWEETPAQSSPAPLAPAASRGKVNPGKVKLVAELLGLSEEDEDTLLARLIDEFLAARNA